jgi:hypothetical protein
VIGGDNGGFGFYDEVATVVADGQSDVVLGGGLDGDAVETELVLHVERKSADRILAQENLQLGAGFWGKELRKLR